MANYGYDPPITELKKTINNLEEKNRKLSRDIKELELVKDKLESDFYKLKEEHSKTKAELNRMKSPPQIIGTIKDVIADDRVVVKSSTGPDFLVSVSLFCPTDNLIPGNRVAMNKQTLGIMSVLPSSFDPVVSGAEIIEKPNITYEDIGGLKQQMLELREAVEDPLLRPEMYAKVGIEPPKGVLLVGPPGTGKTLMAKAVANATNATFIRMVGSELVQKYIGEGARLVRELFDLAKQKAPSIIFIDELDSVGAMRLDGSTSGDREVQRTLMQLLSELDGFTPLSNVKIIGATNRPDILDEALLRPGRFDRIVDVGLPDAAARYEIFKIHIFKMNTADDISLKDLAELTEGASGAEIKSICTEAGMLAIRNNRSKVYRIDFINAKNKVIDAGRTKRNQTPAYMFG